MKVLKFGGTSVGSAQRMKNVAKLIVGEYHRVVSYVWDNQFIGGDFGLFV